jgi:hypothetical protein
MDWNQVGAALIVAVTPVVSMVLVWVLKLAWAKIPASIVLFAAPVAGIVANFAINYIAGQVPSSIIVAAALGLIATTLREWITTLTTKGLNGPVTPTNLQF